MTNKEAIEKFKKIKRGSIYLIHQRQEGKEVIEDYSLCDMAISALQARDLQSTCNQLATDCISRQEAYKVLTDYYHHKTEIQHMGLKEALNRVPPAQQDYDKIIAEIKQCISETREHGKHHAKFVQDNGEIYISGLEMALSIIEENR